MIEHHDQPTARLEHAIDLVDHRLRVGDVVEHPHRTDDVEMIVGERQMLPIDLDEGAPQSALRKPFAAQVDGGRGGIDAGEAGVRSTPVTSAPLRAYWNST